MPRLSDRKRRELRAQELRVILDPAAPPKRKRGRPRKVTT